jgi:outer membrane lipoprotein SlyB
MIRIGSRFLLAITTLLCLISCESKAGTGALAGAGVGAVGGALITGSGTGALIGAGALAASGALIGAALDESDRRSLNRESPSTTRKIDRGEQLSTEDVKKMTKAGLSDNVITAQIDATHIVFHLSSADIIDLKKAGVSQRVINHMIQTRNK